MGKTKTSFVGGAAEEKLTSEEKYKLKQAKRAEDLSAKASATAEEVKLVKDTDKSGSEKKGGEKAAKVIKTKTPKGVKVVSGDTTERPTSAKATEGDTADEKSISAVSKEPKQSKPKVRSKKYAEARALVDKSKTYSAKEAIELVKKTSTTKFDGTVELHLVVKKQGLSANVSLPHSTGSSKKIEFADEKTLKQLEKGKIDFDILLATAEMMPRLVPFARLLGPKGLMPNPKTGTVVKSKADVKNFSADTINLKTEKKAPLMHTTLGKVSMDSKALVENLEAILSGIIKTRIERAYLTSTMGPSVKVEI